MTIEIHELVIEARVTDDDSEPAERHAGVALLDEQQLIERITRQVLRQVQTQLCREKRSR
ncbi:DUF5908 family protein [Serratia rubidaea]|uniref:DUF5908 family protein n=1 Tax=Serratia rubidaea TaxID=61652 RepID=UPI00177E53EC|nr:DUF5908 family protein [Serratia rubidaea]MBD8451060.1 hypothetical protein [Serratia rubidaea]MDK1704063.1 DUF5908 family protein [Serratia rubidaea]HDJ1440009.1 hypothetical protein [Serratia rubidaea]HDJ1447441.1 hypothetical protein [Serratia rubidaea]HDJ1463824.1 hypothetical protein [Serratia rubidaea]